MINMDRIYWFICWKICKSFSIIICFCLGSNRGV